MWMREVRCLLSLRELVRYVSLNVTAMLTDIWTYVATPDPERPAKRKAPSPMSADDGKFATVSAVSYG